MSITGVLNTAVTGLFASQTALRTIANNITNINTEGYARQVVSLENIVVGGTSAGVQITDVQRIVDRFLQVAGLDASARFAAAESQNQFNGIFQGLLGRPDSQSTIAARMNQLFGVIADLALDPSGQILRQSTLASMQDLADEINRISGSIQDLRNEASRQIQEKVTAANEALSRIHDLNPLIVRQRTIGGESAGLENRRDQALTDLSELIDIRVARNGNGSIGITTSSGAVLLDSSLRELEYNAPGVVTSETLFNPIQIWRIDNLSRQRVGSGRDFDHQITSGSLRGLLDLRDDELRDLSLTLGELSAKFIDQVNAVHNSFSAVPPPNQLVGRNTGFINQNDLFTGVTTFAVVDQNNLLVRKVDIDFAVMGSLDDVVNAVNAGLAGDGTLALVGGVMTLTATNASHGVLMADDPNNPSSRGGQSFSQFFGMNDLLEAAVRPNYDTGVIGGMGHQFLAGGLVTFEVRGEDGRSISQYTLDPNALGGSFQTVLNDLNGAGALGSFFDFSLNANGAMVITPDPGFEGARLTVLSDTTDLAGNGVSLTQLFGIGDRYLVDPSKNIKVIDRISKFPSRMALSLFDRTAAIGSVALSQGDQAGALAFQSMETAVIQFDAAGDLSATSASLSQYAAAFYSSAGFKAARAESRAEDQGALLAEITKRIADVSGVNLDEELANMIVLQNSFNAAARLITTSEEMFDALLNAV